MLLLSFSSNGGYHNTRVTGKRLIYLKLKPVRYIGVYKGKGRGKGKGHPITGHESPEVEERYSSTLSLTSELNGVGGQRHDPAAIPPGMTRYPLYRRLGGSPGPVWTGVENIAFTGIRSSDLPALASRYID